MVAKSEIVYAVVAATSFLMPTVVLFVFVSLRSSVANTGGTTIDFKIDVVTTTVLQNFATVLNSVRLQL